MKTSAILKNTILFIVLSLNCYAIIDGIRLQSYWGITLSVCSLAALMVCIRLLKKMEVEVGEAEEK